MVEKIVVNGNIRTGNPEQPRAEALAIRGGRIAALGSNEEIRALAGARTEIIDAGGALVLPGFIDSHVHLMGGGLSLLSVSLRNVSSKQEFIRRVEAAAREVPKGEWILNGDWDHQSFNPVELPRKEWIDGVTRDHPVCLNRLDEHMVLANSAALRLARLSRDTPVPRGGDIVKDPASGEPTGILKDAAMDLVMSVIPEPSPEKKRRAVRAALKAAAAKGVTSVHDVEGAEGIDMYGELLREGELNVRIYFYVPIEAIDAIAELDPLKTCGSDRLRFGGVKGFIDGSLGSQTAWFDTPYADDPTMSGILAAGMFPEGIMEKRIVMADAAGLQAAIHAIGDRANAVLLDMYERTIGRNGRRDRRFRIEHAQHLRPADFARFARLGVVASVQPYHLIDDGRWAEARIGPERVGTTYAFRSFLEAGASLAFGSDWPVAPLDPILGIYAAVTRATLDGKRPDGWNPSQKISVEEAVRAFTAGGAYAEFAEREKGALAPGMLADLVVLNTDIFRVASERIPEAKIARTVCGGQTTFET
ncbi:MAG: amidohydrolase [Candidatus Aminicenantes bacterium]|nr:amidohydrolase [Candidatus Aminicenantes bacterium]